MLGHSQSEENPKINGFVPANQWNELRQQFDAEPSQARGFRSLTAALQAENPDLSGSRIVMDRPKAPGGTEWQPEPVALQPGSVASMQAEQVVSGMVSTESDVDECFASPQFMDHLDWSLQTIELRSGKEHECATDADQELGLMETVQDLSRILARGTARRVEKRVADRRKDDIAMPD